MARSPDSEKREEILSREHLDELGHDLAHISMNAVRDFYQRAYRCYRIINARATQELVQAWKQLRKWRLKVALPQLFVSG